MHEIRNPLEALSNLTYLANQEADHPDKVREYMQLADEKMNTVARIARQTLGFVRSTGNQDSVDLVAIAEAALRIHQRSIDTKKLRLIKDLKTDTTAPVARGEMLQVISNLVMNAIDALPAEGVLCLRLRKTTDEVKLTIADNGHGIPREYRKKIFNAFFTTKQGRGTGLGPHSRKELDRYRGTIRVRSSVRPGKSGTIFRVSLSASEARHSA